MIRTVAGLTRLLNVLQTRCVDWRRLLDTLRAELDKHDLPEYFRLLKDNVKFLMANNTIRAQIRDGTLHMIRLDGIKCKSIKQEQAERNLQTQTNKAK